MPRFTTPSSGSLREFNKAHEPKGTADRNADGRGDGGQFAKRDGYSPTSHDTTVGVTSYRSPSQPGAGDKTNRAAYARMHELTAALEKTGAEIDAKPAQGAWQGAWEPSWMVNINAGTNWDAGAILRELAKVGESHNQDAVLLMHRCLNDCNSVYADLSFEGGVGQQARDAIGEVLAAAGMGGWTWFKGAGGKTTIRMAHVPAWSERTVEDHLAAVEQVRAALAATGYSLAVAKSRVRVEVMEREQRTVPTPGVRSYGQVLNPPKAPGRKQPGLTPQRRLPPGGRRNIFRPGFNGPPADFETR